MAIIVGMLGSGAAQAQVMANPYSYSCGTFLAAQDRAEANAMLYWSVGFLQGRLAHMPTVSLTADSFEKDISDVHAALMRICPNVPDMALATFMTNLAADFENSARPQQ